ncbi:hypothetical protein SFUMM280S_09694 [Streptomyces fumanus]
MVRWRAGSSSRKRQTLSAPVRATQRSSVECRSGRRCPVRQPGAPASSRPERPPAAVSVGHGRRPPAAARPGPPSRPGHAGSRTSPPFRCPATPSSPAARAVVHLRPGQLGPVRASPRAPTPAGGPFQQPPYDVRLALRHGQPVGGRQDDARQPVTLSSRRTRRRASTGSPCQLSESHMTVTIRPSHIVSPAASAARDQHGGDGTGELRHPVAAPGGAARSPGPGGSVSAGIAESAAGPYRASIRCRTRRGRSCAAPPARDRTRSTTPPTGAGARHPLGERAVPRPGRARRRSAPSQGSRSPAPGRR